MIIWGWGVGGVWLVHVISNTMDNDIRDGNAAQYFVKRVEKLLRIRIYLSFWKKNHTHQNRVTMVKYQWLQKVCLTEKS